MGFLQDATNRIEAMFPVLETALKPVNASETQASFTVRGISEQNLCDYVRKNNLVDEFESDFSTIFKGHKYKFVYHECKEYRMTVVLRWHSEDTRTNFCETYSATHCWTAKIEIHIHPKNEDGSLKGKNPKKLFLKVNQKTGEVGRTRNDTSIDAHIPIVDNVGALRRSPSR